MIFAANIGPEFLHHVENRAEPLIEAQVSIVLGTIRSLAG
jgi:hypothetical protein